MTQNFREIKMHKLALPVQWIQRFWGH